MTLAAVARASALSALVMITVGCGQGQDGTRAGRPNTAPSSTSTTHALARTQARTATRSASSAAAHSIRRPAVTSSKTEQRPPTRTASPQPQATSTRPKPLAPSRKTLAPRTSTGRAPLIVLDPGHSIAVTKIDSRTGLTASDYENEPEMRDVWAVAVLVRRRLRAAGYRVAMTKSSLYHPADLAHRAYLARRLHADLALSIHDQAGANGGINFNQGNDIVYFQTVGTYRSTASGRKVVFTDAGVAAKSRRYGAVFQRERQAYERHRVSIRGNVGYNLGARGLPAGNIWMVQLLSDVPWIYNEAGGNSAGRIGLSAHDKRLYANGLVASVEHCLPLPPR